MDIWTYGQMDIGTFSLFRELSKYIQIAKNQQNTKKCPIPIYKVYILYINNKKIMGKKKISPRARVRIGRV